jgi:hypothetical protein
MELSPLFDKMPTAKYPIYKGESQELLLSPLIENVHAWPYLSCITLPWVIRQSLTDFL